MDREVSGQFTAGFVFTDLSRRIFSLVEIIASLITAVMAGETLILDITAGFGGRVRCRRGRSSGCVHFPRSSQRLASGSIYDNFADEAEGCYDVVVCGSALNVTKTQSEILTLSDRVPGEWQKDSEAHRDRTGSFSSLPVPQSEA